MRKRSLCQDGSGRTSHKNNGQQRQWLRGRQQRGTRGGGFNQRIASRRRYQDDRPRQPTLMMAPVLSRLGATFENVTSSPTTTCVTPTAANASDANRDDIIPQFTVFGARSGNTCVAAFAVIGTADGFVQPRASCCQSLAESYYYCK